VLTPKTSEAFHLLAEADGYEHLTKVIAAPFASAKRQQITFGEPSWLVRTLLPNLTHVAVEGWPQDPAPGASQSGSSLPWNATPIPESFHQQYANIAGHPGGQLSLARTEVPPESKTELTGAPRYPLVAGWPSGESESDSSLQWNPAAILGSSKHQYANVASRFRGHLSLLCTEVPPGLKIELTGASRYPLLFFVPAGKSVEVVIA
jgi:hypothetical protein